MQIRLQTSNLMIGSHSYLNESISFSATESISIDFAVIKKLWCYRKNFICREHASIFFTSGTDSQVFRFCLHWQNLFPAMAAMLIQSKMLSLCDTQSMLNFRRIPPIQFHYTLFAQLTKSISLICSAYQECKQWSPSSFSSCHEDTGTSPFPKFPSQWLAREVSSCWYWPCWAAAVPVL
jgi:hypothetical protein